MTITAMIGLFVGCLGLGFAFGKAIKTMRQFFDHL